MPDFTSSLIANQNFPIGHKKTLLYMSKMKDPAAKLVVKAEQALLTKSAFSSEVKNLISRDPDKVLDIFGFVKDISNLLKNKNKDVVYKSITDIVSRSISDQIKGLKNKYSVKLDPKISKILANSFNPNSKFLNSTMDRRLNIVFKQTNKDLLNIYNSKMTSKQKIDSAQAYISGRTYGRNNFRPTARILVSETNRQIQEGSSRLGEYLTSLGYKVKYEWVLSTMPGRKKDICDVYAKRRFYTEKTLPSYPHPFCSCRIAVIILKSPKEEKIKYDKEELKDLIGKRKADRVDKIVQRLEDVAKITEYVNNTVQYTQKIFSVLGEPDNWRNYLNLFGETSKYMKGSMGIAAQDLFNIITDIDTIVHEFINIAELIDSDALIKMKNFISALDFKALKSNFSKVKKEFYKNFLRTIPLKPPNEALLLLEQVERDVSLLDSIFTNLEELQRVYVK